ncbi:hypothetical protein QUC31_006701 [Theobroma cacao]
MAVGKILQHGSSNSMSLLHHHAVFDWLGNLILLHHAEGMTFVGAKSLARDEKQPHLVSFCLKSVKKNIHIQIGGNMVALSTWKWGGIPSGFKLKGLRRQKCKHGDRYKNLMTQQNNS